MEQITFDEFKRMDLRVGQILHAEKVEGTQKFEFAIYNQGPRKRGRLMKV